MVLPGTSRVSMIQKALIYLAPYFLEVVGAILIASPWLQDQRYRHLVDTGTDLMKDDQEDVARLGAVLQRRGLRRLIGVDSRQILLVWTGIILLGLSFALRVCFVLFLPPHL